MMKRSDYCNIASYSELCTARNENYKAMKKLKVDMPRYGIAIVESLTPKSLWNGFMHYVSPLISLYRRFCQ